MSGFFINFLWPLSLIISSVTVCVTAMMTGKIALRLQTIITPVLWIVISFYLLIWSRESIFLLGVSLVMFVLHSLFMSQNGKDNILLSSTSFAVIICFNMWGSKEFEVIALTLLVEMITWIISFFLLTISDLQV